MCRLVCLYFEFDSALDAILDIKDNNTGNQEAIILIIILHSPYYRSQITLSEKFVCIFADYNDFWLPCFYEWKRPDRSSQATKWIHIGFLCTGLNDIC